MSARHVRINEIYFRKDLKIMMGILRAARILLNGIKLRCPACGQGPLYKSLFRMNRSCSCCGLVFEREQGYFVGAIYVNVIVTELLLGLIYFIYFFTASVFDPRADIVMVVLALLLPMLLYHHARGIWLCFDQIIDPSKELIRGERMSLLKTGDR
jgi:uncharacterized protein (DUF983 family)